MKAEVNRVCKRNVSLKTFLGRFRACKVLSPVAYTECTSMLAEERLAKFLLRGPSLSGVEYCISPFEGGTFYETPVRHIILISRSGMTAPGKKVIAIVDFFRLCFCFIN